MVCKKSWNGAASSSIFMFGVLFGSAGFGMVADKLVLFFSLFGLESNIKTTYY